MSMSGTAKRQLELEVVLGRPSKAGDLDADNDLTTKQEGQFTGEAGAKRYRAALARSKGVSEGLRVRESALFRPGKSIAVVKDEVPLVHFLKDDDNYIVTSWGHQFVTMKTDILRPFLLSPRINDKIQALHVVGDTIITSLSRDIVAWHLCAELGRFRGHTAPAKILCNVGTQFLVSASDAETLLWKLADIGIQLDEVSTHKSCVMTPLMQLEIEGGCTAVCHPPTYLHKILVGTSTGSVELWNVRSCERVHKFQAHRPKGQKLGAITCLCPAPRVLDIVAVGFASGRICLLNAREDTALMEFDQSQGRITAMSFRTGHNAPAHLVSGSPDGTVIVWDLNKKRAHHTLNNVHRGPVTSLHYLLDQPMLVTGGNDNSVREYLFESIDGIPRLYRQRKGCPGPPRRMSFYDGETDTHMVVHGKTEQGGGFVACLTLSHMDNEEYAQDTSKLPKHYKHFAQVPPVIDSAFSFARHFDWPNVVTAHEGCAAAFVWSHREHRMTGWCLEVPQEDPSFGVPVTAVAVSRCGNYAITGLEHGGLHRFNLQSQLHRGAFPKGPEVMEGKKAALIIRAHRGRVCGITVTITGKVVSVSSHPKDCRLRLFGLTTHDDLGSVPLDGEGKGQPSCLQLRAQGDLVAVSQDDGNVLIVDLQGLNVVRTFECGMPATDIAFSSDSRWLATALRDGSVRIFDLPASRCVDSFMFTRPAISLCFSPSNAYLLTSHTRGCAVQTWANKFLFDPSLSAPLLASEPTKPILIDEPHDGQDDEDEDEETQGSGKVVALREKLNAHEAANPLGPDLLTLSDVPPQKWLATLHLDLVKERNKAKEPPKPLPNAPFFLPTALDGMKPHFVAPTAEAEEPENTSRILKGERRSLEGTPFQVALRKSDFDAALMWLKEQTPSGVHLALEELGELAGGDASELKSVLKFFAYHMRKAHYADELQAYLALFLQSHGDDIAADEELRALCGELTAVQDQLWSTLSVQCQKARCFLGILTQTQTQW